MTKKQLPIEKVFLGKRGSKEPPKHKLHKNVDWVAFGEAFENLSDGLVGVYEMCARSGFSPEFWRQHKDELLATYWSKLQTGELEWIVTDKGNCANESRKKNG